MDKLFKNKLFIIFNLLESYKYKIRYYKNLLNHIFIIYNYELFLKIIFIIYLILNILFYYLYIYFNFHKKFNY